MINICDFIVSSNQIFDYCESGKVYIKIKIDRNEINLHQSAHPRTLMKIILSRITGFIALIQSILGILILYNNSQECYYVWVYILINVILACLHTLYVIIHDCKSDGTQPIETSLINSQGINLNRFYLVVGLMGISGLVLYLYLPLMSW